MQLRNLLLFFLLSAVLLFGWFQLRQRWLAPQQANNPPADKKPAPAKAPPADGDALAKADVPDLPPPTPADRLLRLGSEEGNSAFHLGVTLDPRGAGVRQVVLNKFKDATAEGRPGTGRLDLVPAKANREHPSHRLYHYANDDARHPLDTLGLAEWKVVKENGRAVVRDTIDAYGQERQRQRVTFEAEAAGVVVRKTYSLTEGEYHLGLEVRLERKKGKGAARGKVKFRYQLTGAHGLPVEGKWYTGTFRNTVVAQVNPRGGVHRDLEELRQISLKEGGDPVTRGEGYQFRYAGVAVQYFASVIVVDDFADNPVVLDHVQPTLEVGVAHGTLKAVARDDTGLLMTSGNRTEAFYFRPRDRDKFNLPRKGEPLAVIFEYGPYDPKLAEAPKVVREVRTGDEAKATHALWEDDVTVRVSTEAAELEEDKPVVHHYLLYNGPVKVSQLGQLSGDRAVPDELVTRYHDTLALNTLTDYHSPNWFSEHVLNRIWWTSLVIHCTNLMHRVLGGLNWLVPNYGLCIILLTVLVRGLMFPVSRKQALTSLKMQELAPEVKKLGEKYKEDPHGRQRAQMELFRKHGVNPFGTCWLLLLQMPIFMGLYYALQESILFRLAPFWPTWITNLAAPDMMVYWSDKIPYISQPEDFGGFIYLGPYFNLLPVIAVALMIMQQKFMTPPPADEQQAMQQKMMKYMMIFFGLMFYKVAAGLCVYFIASSLWGFAERKLLPKYKPKLDAAGVGPLSDGAAASEGVTARAPAVSSGSIKTAGEVTAVPGRGRKGARARRRGDQRGREPLGAVRAPEPADGSAMGRLRGWWRARRERLREWWDNVLEQARKK
jgi:YidC/Oxa1 family membrane protein insertase